MFYFGEIFANGSYQLFLDVKPVGPNGKLIGKRRNPEYYLGRGNKTLIWYSQFFRLITFDKIHNVVCAFASCII